MANWQNASKGMLGMEAEDVAVPEKGDKRFKNEEWQKNPLFDFIKQSYLLVAQKIQSTVCSVECVNAQATVFANDPLTKVTGLLRGLQGGIRSERISVLDHIDRRRKVSEGPQLDMKRG